MPGPALRLLRAALLVLGLLLLTAAVAAWAASERRLRRRYPASVATVAPRADSAGLARGRHLYRTITCALCHGEDGGGAVYADQGPVMLLAGPNLTTGRGGVGALRSDPDLVRAIRHGIRPDGTSLIVMPSEVFVHLTDADLGALLGHIRSLPPVDREVPVSHFGPVGRLLLATGRMDILVAPKTPPFEPGPDVEPGPTAAYGRYLADISGCHGCHGYGLSGGRVAGPPDLPPASNLTPAGLARWTAGDFTALMREGRRPDGSQVHDFMPWREFRRMTDDDLAALWAYLQGVPPKAFGNK